VIFIAFCSCALRLVLSRSFWTSDIPPNSHPPRPSMTFGGRSRRSFPTVTTEPNQSSSRVSRRTPCRFAPTGRGSLRTPALRRKARQRTRARSRRFLRTTLTRLCTKCGMCVALFPPPNDPVSPVARSSDTVFRQHGRPRGSENITAGCNYSFCSTSRLALTSTRRKIYGILSFCGFLPPSIVPSPPKKKVCADGNRYEKRKRRTTPVTETYHFIGYSSLYPFYCFPDKVRLRLRFVPLFSFSIPSAPLTTSQPIRDHPSIPTPRTRLSVKVVPFLRSHADSPS
jgi:hypothetical protein